MQKLFLISFILATLIIPVRRARREPAHSIGRVVTDFSIYLIVFAVLLRLVFVKLG